MKNNKILSALTLASALFFVGCANEAPAPKVQKKVQNTNKQEIRHDIQVINASYDGNTTKILAQIEKGFMNNGIEISANNDMNKPFSDAFGETDKQAGKDFVIYRLMPVYHEELSVKLIKDYPKFGLISPISTSVYSKNGDSISISILSLEGMSRISGVPVTNPDLIAYSKLITKSLSDALPNGTHKTLDYKVLRPDGELVTKFTFILPNESGDIEEAMEAYEEQMEGEIESVGFKTPAFTEMEVEGYEFYKTMSICKFDVIYPVHKIHPEAGAFAPCTMYKYKKEGDKFTRMGYPSVYNWIKSTNIFDDYSLEPLIDAQNLLESTIDSTIE
ncbi:MAG: hypothetical protein U9O56_09865 [Campylobacterota bacterium]|nr:hypothetical protein [Campylobacterota bacterium]